MKEVIGSEIPSLDSRDEAVLSDSQLHDMSQYYAPVIAPAPVTPLPKQVMNDIVPPSSSLVMPTMNAASQSAPPVIAPTPAPTPVTMSREDALKLALSDESVALPPKTGARPIALVLSALTMVLLGAYLWQSNYPAFALKLASVKSGVEAAAPGYLPNGWQITRDVQANNGELRYKLQKQDRQLTVSQQKSNLDSQALLEQYILPKSQEYLALQAQGLTIYMYNNNQAAWVNRGIVYKIEGDSGLDQEQIIRVATSL